jgi:hypothetical protein
MFEFIASFILLMLVMLAMSFSFMVSGRHFKRSCGGIINLKKLIGFTPCEACKQQSPECPLRPPPSD